MEARQRRAASASNNNNNNIYIILYYIHIYIYSDIYIILMLQLYNCTGSYNFIVKYKQSIAFGNIYIGGHFLGSREGESDKRPQNVTKSPSFVILNITLYSLDVNISAVRTTASDKGQERRYPWKTRPYRLQCVQY